MDNSSFLSNFIATFNFAWHYWSEYRYTIIIVLLLTTAQIILQVFLPILTGDLVNSFSDSTANWTASVWLCGLLVGAKLISYICRTSAVYLWNKPATEVMKEMVTESFDKVQHFSTEWHLDNLAGSVVRNINRGCWALEQFSSMLCMSIYQNTVLSIGLIIILFKQGLFIGILGLLGFVIFFFITKVLSTKYLVYPFQELNQVDTQMNGMLSDAIICSSLVKTFAAEEYESKKLQEIAEDWRIKNQSVWQRMETFSAVQNISFSFMEAGIVGLAIWLWIKGLRTPGDVITILTSFQMIQVQMMAISNDINAIQRTMTDLEEVVNLDKIDNKIVDAPEAIPLKIQEAAISFEQVSFSYKNQTTPFYENLSVKIAGSEKVALIGYSGSGKSTFVKLIQRLYDIDSGKIMIDDQDIKSITKKSLRAAIAVVPQEAILFHRSIAENIAYAKPDATQEEIEQAARQAYAHDFIMALPDGYQTQVGERGTKLSGGERQRITIARAILSNCPILVLDEATSSLDSVSEDLIQKALNNLMTGRTIIIIAHRLSTIQTVDRILVFSQGKIIEQGSQEELLADVNSHYRKIYASQFNGFLQESQVGLSVSNGREIMLDVN
jgi:ATP-binding cassette subfamily B protein